MSLIKPKSRDYYLNQSKKTVPQISAGKTPEEKVEIVRKPLINIKGAFSNLGEFVTKQIGIEEDRPYAGMTSRNAWLSQMVDQVKKEGKPVVDPLLYARLYSKKRFNDIQKLKNEGVVVYPPTQQDIEYIRDLYINGNPEKKKSISVAMARQKAEQSIKTERFIAQQQQQAPQQIQQITPGGQVQTTPDLSKLTASAQPQVIQLPITEEEINARIPQELKNMHKIAEKDPWHKVQDAAQKKQALKELSDYIKEEGINPDIDQNRKILKEIEQELLDKVEGSISYDDIKNAYVNSTIDEALLSGKLVKSITKEGKYEYVKEPLGRPAETMMNGAIEGFLGGAIKFNLEPTTIPEKASYAMGNAIGTIYSFAVLGGILRGGLMLTKAGTQFLTKAPHLAELAISIGAFNIHGQLNQELWGSTQSRVNAMMTNTLQAVLFHEVLGAFKTKLGKSLSGGAMFGAISKLSGGSDTDVLIDTLVGMGLPFVPFIKPADAFNNVNTEARKNFKNLTGFELKNNYEDTQLEMALNAGIKKIVGAKPKEEWTEKQIQKINSLTETYKHLRALPGAYRFFAPEGSFKNNIQRTIRQVNKELNNLVGLIDPSNKVKKFIPVAMNEIIAPTEPGKPKVTANGDVIILDTKVSPKLTKGQVDYLMSPDGKKAYIKRVQELRTKFKNGTGAERAVLRSRIEDLQALGFALGYEGRRVTDIIPSIPDPIYEAGVLDRALYELSNQSTILLGQEKGNEYLPDIRKSVNDIAKISGMNEGDIAREVIRRVKEISTGEKQYGAWVEEKEINDFLATVPSENGVIPIQELLVTRPLEGLSSSLRGKLSSIKLTTEEVRGIAKGQEKFLGTERGQMVQEKSKLELNKLYAQKRSALIESELRKEFPYWSNAMIKEYKEILDRAIKTQEPVELARKEIARTKPIEQRIESVIEEVQKAQKNLAPEQVKQQETATKLIKVLAKDLTPKVEEIPIGTTRAREEFVKEGIKETTTNYANMFSREDIKLFNTIIKLKDTKFATEDVETIRKSKYGKLFDKSVEILNEVLGIGREGEIGQREQLSAEEALDFMRKLPTPTERAAITRKTTKAPLAQEARKSFELLRTSVSPTIIKNEIGRLTHTTLETPLRIVVDNWKKLNLPDSPYLTQMESIVKTLKPKQYFSLGAFENRIRITQATKEAGVKPKPSKYEGKFWVDYTPEKKLEAIKDLETAIAKNPESPWVKEYQKHIDQIRESLAITEISPKGEEINVTRIDEINDRLKILNKEIMEKARMTDEGGRSISVVEELKERKTLMEELGKFQPLATQEKIKGEAITAIPPEQDIEVSTLPKSTQRILKEFGYEEQYISQEKYGDIMGKAYDIVLGEGKEADVGVFITGEPIKFGSMDKIRPMEFPELVSFARELTGEVPYLKKFARAVGMFYSKDGSIALSPELFKEGNAEQLAAVLSHELGHMVDWFPEKSSINRGNLLGHLLSIRKYLLNTFGEVNVTNSDLRKELKDVSFWWRPFDEETSTPGFKNYRNSSKELYADAISVLFNNPGELESRAPKFYEKFFEFMDKKPEAKNAYFDLQQLLNQDRTYLLAKNREDVGAMFGREDFAAKELQKLHQDNKKASIKNFIDAFKYGLLSKNEPIYKKVTILEKQGVFIPDDRNPKYLMSERNQLAGKYKAFAEEKIQPVFTELAKNKVDWNTFGEYLLYDRVANGDRSEIANPRGITPDRAKELIDYMREDIGEARMKIIEKNATTFRESFKELIDMADKGGMITEEARDSIKENKHYAPFRALEYLDQYLGWGIKKQTGTLLDVANPANSLVLKSFAVIRAIEAQKSKTATIDMLKNNYSREIKDAETMWNGRYWEPKESRDPDWKLITYYDNGKLKGKYVDPHIADALNRDSIARSKALIAVMSPLRALNRTIFRPLFVVYNPGWIPFNMIRDFMRFWKNTPGMNFAKAVINYKRAMPAAKIRAFGLKEGAGEKKIKAAELVRELEKMGIMTVSWNEFNSGQDIDSAQRTLEFILERAGMVKKGQKYPKIAAITKQLRKPLEFIKNLGTMVEALPKIAGYYELKGKMEPHAMAEFIRKNIGSPDFLEKGAFTPVTNEVFLFSNAILQSIWADTKIATNPTTRSGFWWKTLESVAIPKILMFAAMAGAFGPQLKKMYEDASEYDMTNYIIIPFGRDENLGKTTYLRIPIDETGRLLGGLVWKSLRAGRNNQSLGKDLGDMASFFGGQLPTWTPTISLAGDTLQFLQGQNPYDSFRQRNVLTDTQFAAGGMEALKPFLSYLFQQAGGNIFMRLSIGQQPTAETTQGERFLNLPIVSNVFGRFVRISDYGQLEKLKQISAKISSENAKELIHENTLINKAIIEYRNGDTKTEVKRRELTLDIFEKLFGHKPKTQDEVNKYKRLLKKLDISIVRGESSQFLNALISAKSIDEEVALLQLYKEVMTENQFKELKKEALQHKIISQETSAKVKYQP